MPLTTFDDQNRVNKGFENFPKLKFENKGEYARVVLLDPQPFFEYTHRLVAPKLINGVPEKEFKERKNGDKIEVYATDFIGTPICLGDLGKIRDKGSDPDNCPMCKLAREGDQVLPPVRRFAMPIIKYNTKPQGVSLIEPYGCQVLVWAFSEPKYDKLVDLKNTWDDLRKHDLIMGPCTNVGYQNFDIQVGPTAEWMGTPDRQRLTAEVWKNNQPQDLAAFCGRKTERKWIEDDLDKIMARWAAVQRYETGQATPEAAALLSQIDAAAAAPTLTEGLEDLLGGVATPAASKAGSSGEEISGFESLLDGVSNAAPTDDIASLLGESAATVPVTPEQPKEPESDLLAGLGEFLPGNTAAKQEETIAALPEAAPADKSEPKLVNIDDILNATGGN